MKTYLLRSNYTSKSYEETLVGTKATQETESS